MNQRTVTWQDPSITAQQVPAMDGLTFLERIRDGELPPPPIAMLMDMTLENVEYGDITFGMHPADFHYNPIGIVHGGAISTLLDSALGCAVQSTLPIGVGYTTTQLNINFVRPVTSQTGHITCHATIVHCGRRSATAEGRVMTAEGKLIAHGTTTCMLFPIEGMIR